LQTFCRKSLQSIARRIWRYILRIAFFAQTKKQLVFFLLGHKSFHNNNNKAAKNVLN